MNRIITATLLTLVISITGGCTSDGGGGTSSFFGVESIAITPADASIVYGLTQQFTATAAYSDGTTKDVTSSATWSSSDTNVATIDTAGLATSVAAGTTTISATFENVTGETTLTVTAAAVASIAITPASADIDFLGTQQFTAMATYTDGSEEDVTATGTWSSSNTDAVTIDTAGLAASVAAGSTTITATLSDVSAEAALNIRGLIRLAKTGRIESYVAAEIAGDDSDLKMGVAWPNPRFTPSAGTEIGCMTDNLTGLMWMQSPTTDFPNARTWADAITDANNLSHCGHDDWRLPNVEELRSLLDYGQSNQTVWLMQAGFMVVDTYWSSTTTAGVGGSARVVSILNSAWNSYTKTEDDNYVWPVRGESTNIRKTGQTESYATGDDGDLEMGVSWPSPRFVALTGERADCITDNLTGLMWVKAPDFSSQTWSDAITYANDLSLCGYDDWRLPNINELTSLRNYGQDSSTNWLNQQGFNIEDAPFWSSTTSAGDTANALVLSIVSSDEGTGNKTNIFSFLPVRGGE